MKDPDGKLKWAQLDSPLEFDARVDDSLTNFELELTEVAAVNNAQNISKYIKSLANRRNRVLYAAPGGIPHVKTGVESFLIFRKAVVFTHLMTYLLIEPYCNRQQFVSQSLDAFLQLLNLLKKENLGK